jgi:SAM-dependent methyltransferase
MWGRKQQLQDSNASAAGSPDRGKAGLVLNTELYHCCFCIFPARKNFGLAANSVKILHIFHRRFTPLNAPVDRDSRIEEYRFARLQPARMPSTHDIDEIKRSASEASKITIEEVDLTRYRNPPAETVYPLEYCFHLLGDVANKVVLDYGCGSGEEAVPLCQRGARVIGIDISPDLIAIARQRLQKYGVQADLRVGSAYETQLADESVDVVFCMSLIHHLEIDRVKNEICRVLKPGGRFIFKEPVRLSRTMKQLRRMFPPKEDVSDYEYPLNQAQLDELVAGFEVLSCRNFRTPFVPLLERLIKKPGAIRTADDWMLRHLPIEHFATMRVMALRKRQ